MKSCRSLTDTHPGDPFHLVSKQIMLLRADHHSRSDHAHKRNHFLRREVMLVDQVGCMDERVCMLPAIKAHLQSDSRFVRVQPCSALPPSVSS